MSRFNELIAALHTGVVEVKYEKEDGTRVVRRVTLHENLVGDDKAMGDDPITVWDLDRDAWRSFRFERIEEFK